MDSKWDKALVVVICYKTELEFENVVFSFEAAVSNDVQMFSFIYISSFVYYT